MPESKTPYLDKIKSGEIRIIPGASAKGANKSITKPGKARYKRNPDNNKRTYTKLEVLNKKAARKKRRS